MFLEDKAKNPGVRTKLKPWTLDHLIAWLESRDPEETYNWWNTEDCMLCRYAKSITTDYMWFHEISHKVEEANPQHMLVRKVGWEHGKGTNCWTMGNALKAARKLRKKSHVS